MKIVIVLLVLLPLVELSESNDKYCKCNPLHVLCDKGMYNHKKKLIKDSAPSMNRIYRKAVTNNLNTLRHTVARGASIFPHASNMQKLVYSEHLELAAQMQVKNCNPWTGFTKTEEWCNHKCYKCTDIDGLEVHFAKSFSRKMRWRKNSINDVLPELVKPPKAYVFDVSDNYNVPTAREVPGELYEIQYMALQAEYSVVGCSHTYYYEASYFYYTMICAFGPVTPGMMDRPPYKVGTPCSNCSAYSRCTDKKMNSLCEYYGPWKSFKRTEGIGEYGELCQKPKTSEESTTKESHVSGGGNTPKEPTYVLDDQLKKNGTHKAPARKKGCITLNLRVT